MKINDLPNAPLVSIIIPVYNAGKYLFDCLNSVIAQSYKNIEIIIINDGSTDDSGKVSKEFCQIDKRIRLIDQDNNGAAKSRNLGIKESCGKYIVFVDADDVIESQYVEKLVSSIIKYDVDISICGFVHGGISNKIVTIKKDKVGVLYDDYAELPTNTVCLQGPVCKCYKADIIKRYNIKFPEDVRYGEDQQFNLEYYSYATKYIFLKDVLYKYFRRGLGSSVASVYNKKTLNEEFISMSKLNCFLQDYKVNNRGIVLVKQAYQLLARFQYNKDFSYITFKYIEDELKKYDYHAEIRCSPKIDLLRFLLNTDAYYVIYLSLKCVRYIRNMKLCII